MDFIRNDFRTVPVSYFRLHFSQEVSIMKVWAYLHPELNILCCALLPEAVPEGVEAVELEVETPDDVVL
jgi:hypothetical protein